MIEHNFRVSIKIDIDYPEPPKTSQEEIGRKRNQAKMDYKAHKLERKVKELLEMQELMPFKISETIIEI